jgi:NADH dehydrogenase
MILVVGATGTLGGTIAKRLAEQGKQVRALVRPQSDAADLKRLGIEAVLGDLKEPASLERACEGAEALVTTANSAGRGGEDNVESVEEGGNRNLVDAAKAAGVRQFVFTSALGSSLDSPVPFMRGKAVAEQHLRESGVPFTILMPNLFMEVWCPNVVGNAAMAGRPVVLVGEGTRKHSMISIEDVAAFAVATVGNDAARNRTLVLGGPQPLSWRDIVAAYERALGRQLEVEFVPMGDGLPGFPEFISGFMNALETYDSVIEMESTAREFGVRQLTLDEYLQRTVQVASGRT